RSDRVALRQRLQPARAGDVRESGVHRGRRIRDGPLLIGLPARLAAAWIGLLMILSGCADAQPAGDRTPTTPTPIPAATLSTPAAGPTSSQPTKQPAAKPQRTSVT